MVGLLKLPLSANRAIPQQEDAYTPIPWPHALPWEYPWTPVPYPLAYPCTPVPVQVAPTTATPVGQHADICDRGLTVELLPASSRHELAEDSGSLPKNAPPIAAPAVIRAALLRKPLRAFC